LAAALCTVILDPLFIFYLGMGMNGAALANVIADGAALALGLSGIVGKHRFLKHLSFAGLARDFKDIWKIAFPSLLTQLATPFTVAYSTTVVARFGAEALAANAIIGRLVPVAYGIIFSLSGAVGPIIGQNFGAKNFHRVRQTLTDGLTFAAVYTIITSIILLIFRHEIADAFQTTGHAKDLVVFFCTFVAWSWAFAGAQFVANAAFNNLGRPVLSTWYNWGKATLGTIPFALLGAAYYGAEGIMFGLAIGSVIFGIASAMHSFRITRALEMKA
jgi:putative MATE family efflux protein